MLANLLFRALAPSATYPQYVGGVSGVGTDVYNISLAGTLTGGIGTSPQAGDIVVVGVAVGSASIPAAQSVSGDVSGAYTTAHTELQVASTWDVNYVTAYKVMGAVADSSIAVQRYQSSSYGGATVVQVWRGVNPTSPLATAAVTSSGVGSSRGDAPVITPSTPGAVILAFSAGTQTSSGSAFTAPAGMVNAVSVSGNGITSDVGVVVASVNWLGGAYNPAAVTGGTTSASSAWASATIALRPA